MSVPLTWKQRLGRGAVILVLAALALELGLWLRYRQPIVARIFVRVSSPRGYALKPSLVFTYLGGGRRLRVSTDAAGHRVVPGAPASAPRRLHVIGDSQVFGWGLNDEESLPAELQRRLGSGWQVINHGVPGYGPLIYADILSAVPAGEAALVIQTETNDFHDTFYDRPACIARCGYLVTRDGFGEYPPCFILGSYTFQTLLGLKDQYLADIRLAVPLGYTAIGEAAAEVLRSRIESRYAAALAKHGADNVLFTALPWDAALIPARLANYRPVQAAAERRVTLPSSYDLEPALRRYPRPEELFLPADHHLSARGAALVAAELVAPVRRLGGGQ